MVKKVTSQKRTVAQKNFLKAKRELGELVKEMGPQAQKLHELAAKYNVQLDKLKQAFREEALARGESIKEGNISASYKTKTEWDVDKLRDIVPWKLLKESGAVEEITTYRVDEDKVYSFVHVEIAKHEEIAACSQEIEMTPAVRLPDKPLAVPDPQTFVI